MILVELSGVGGGAPTSIRLTKKASQWIDAAIDTIVAERTETHEGDLREIDLDKRSFILRNAEAIQEIPCSFEADLAEAAKEALDRRVRVTGTREIVTGRRVFKPLNVTRLEILDDVDEGTDSN